MDGQYPSIADATKYGGAARYGPGNHWGDPAYDRTQSFNGFFAGLGIGEPFANV